MTLLTVVALELAGYALFLAALQAERPVVLGGLLILLVAAAVAWRRLPGLREGVARAFARHRSLALGLLLFLLATAPILLRRSPYWIFVLTMAALYGLSALALNLQIGTAGVVNFAGGAFYGIGAYTVGLLTVHLAWSPWLALPVGGLLAAAIGMVLFVPILKTRGYYLALVTIAFVFIFNLLVNNMEWTGGPQGVKNIPPLALGGASFARPLPLAGFLLPYHANYFYLVLVLTALATWAATRLGDSWIGLTLNVIRDDEIAAKVSGVAVAPWKLVAFTLGNLVMGLAGGVYAVMVGFISPTDFTFGESLVMISIIILGGLDSTPGILLGALVLILLPERFRVLHDYRLLLYGVVIVVMLLGRPRGLWPAGVRRYGRQPLPGAR